MLQHINLNKPLMVNPHLQTCMSISRDNGFTNGDSHSEIDWNNEGLDQVKCQDEARGVQTLRTQEKVVLRMTYLEL